MATRYQDLLDIDGLNKAIKQLQANSGKFSAAAVEDFKRSTLAANLLKAELERINRTLVNGGKPISIVASGESQKVIELSNQVSALTQQLNNQKKAQEALKGVMDANKQAIADAKIQAAQYTAELQRERTVNQGLKNDIAATTLQTKQLALANKQAATAQTAATGSYKEAQQRLTALGNAIRNTEGGFKSQSPALQAQIKEYNSLNDSLKKFDEQMGNHQRKVGDYKGAIKGLVGDLQQMALSYISIQGALAAATATFDTALKTDATRTSLTFVLGSADAADSKLKELGATADRLGLNFLSLSESYTSFIGAARASNFSMTEAEKIFNSVSGAGARLHLTADQISGSLLAIQQMISKGTVQSEELRGQLGERLPGAFAIAARAMGVTEMELGKLLKSGSVLASDLLPKLSIELDKTFSLDKNTKIESLQASLNNLKNTFTETVSYSSNITSFFKVIIDEVTLLASTIFKTVNSSSWSEFFARITSNKIADQIRALKETSTNSSRTINQYEQLDLTGMSKAELGALFGKVSDQAVEAKRAYLRFRDAITRGDLKDDGSLANYKAQADMLFNFEYQVGTLYKGLKNTVKTGNKEISDAQLTSIKEIRTRITELSKLPGSAIDGSDINNRIDALKARLKELNPATKQAKEGFDILEQKLRDVNQQLEIAILRDYAGNQGKETAATRKLAAEYEKLAQQLVKVKQAREDAIDGVYRRQKIATFGSVFPTFGGATSAPDFSKDQAKLDARSGYEATSAGLEQLAEDYTKVNERIVTSYRKRNISKAEYDRQMLDAETTNTILEYGLQSQLLDNTEAELKANGKTNTKEYRNLTKQRYELDKQYSQDRIRLEMEAAERVKAIYADIFASIQESANTIGGATGKLIGNIGSVIQNAAANQANDTSLSDTEKLQASLSIAGSAVGVYTETAINASKLRMAQIEAEYQNELKLAGDNEEAKTAIANQFNKRQREEAVKQARYQKAQAATEIVINTAIAVSKAIAQGGGLFGLPLAAIVGALGAVQLGLVLAQPLPQYSSGRPNGPAEYAEVNENGPEFIGQGGAFRIANQGRRGITRLRAGDMVKTAAETKHMFANGLVQRSADLAHTMGGAKAAYDTYVMTVAQAPGLSQEQTAEAMRQGVGGIAVHTHIMDENGYRRHDSRVRDRQTFNCNRNKL